MPTRRKKQSAAARPREAQKGGSGFFSDYENPTRTHVKKGQAERSGQAESSGKKGLGVSPDYDTTQHAHAPKKAACSDQAELSEKGSSGA
jgi:hypothetical protein